MPDLAELLDQISIDDRSSQSGTYRSVSPIGSSRYERPFDPREYRSSSRRPTNSPFLPRSESRRPGHSHRSGRSRTSSPGIGVDLSSLGADFDPRPRVSSSRAPVGLGIDFVSAGFKPRRAREQDEFDRLYDQRRDRAPPQRDYYDTMGSGYDGRDPRMPRARTPQLERYDMSSLSGGPPMRYSAGYGAHRSSRPSDAPMTTAEYLESMPSRGGRSSRRDLAFDRDYIPPSDDNRYVYPSSSSRPSSSRQNSSHDYPSSSGRPSSSREHRSHRSGGGFRSLFR